VGTILKIEQFLVFLEKLTANFGDRHVKGKV